MVCKQCGKEIVAGTKFCTQCGAQLVDDFSGLHNASATQSMSSMPTRPESAPVQNRPVQQNGSQGNGTPAKDRNKIILIAALAGGGVALLVILIVVVVSVMNNLSGKIDLQGAAAAVAAAEEEAAEESMPATDEMQSMADALAQVAGTDTDTADSVMEEEETIDPAQMNRNAEEVTPDIYEEYMLPESDVRFYTKAELSGLSPDELRIARNEIFARHGRMYEDAQLRAYFYDKSWYEPLYTADEFDPHMDEILNQYEKANVETIKDLENGEESGALYSVTVDAPDDYVNLREGPGTDYGIIMEIRNGVVLNIYDEFERGRWLYTQYQGEYGWIAASQVRRN